MFIPDSIFSPYFENQSELLKYFYYFGTKKIEKINYLRNSQVVSEFQAVVLFIRLLFAHFCLLCLIAKFARFVFESKLIQYGFFYLPPHLSLFSVIQVLSSAEIHAILRLSYLQLYLLTSAIKSRELISSFVIFLKWKF